MKGGREGKEEVREGKEEVREGKEEGGIGEKGKVRGRGVGGKGEERWGWYEVRVEEQG